ncbi:MULTISPECIES: RNA polymerase sigma factor [Dyella]|uniref:Sigma-70 family RNA polymerase sigma factor n=2 Tax=Dyella TaxID=231454 RepID=A0A4V2NM92_9GAMM|nr:MULTISPECIES: sigma-70 family RNA polymerase sigma factor [Dyella]TBR39993.1 sigma-70 family RNA polymerase sigma factor [Dyella terrae]TCI12427.1 sigma-70 family RNA polymerase sigma factor [Dyella soli]
MIERNHQQHFEPLLREHRRLIAKVASVYARGSEDRRDLEQEICVQLWRAFPAFDPARAKFSTWLYRIALNVAISQVRRVASRDDSRFEPLDVHHLETIGGDAAPEQDERLVALYAFIEELDPLNRALILLYLEDRSYAEMADVLGISETNVATKIGRIKQKLRSQMAATEA